MEIVLYFLFLILLKNNIKCGNSTCFEYSCDECDSPEYGHCTKCREYFRLVDGTCPCADQSCALCDNGLAGLHICKLCKNGYYNNKDDCGCDIEDCEICSENSCKRCKTGYKYNSKENKCEEQDESEKLACFDNNCDACYNQARGGCDYCKDGYTSVKGECVQVPNHDENKKCPGDYYFDDENQNCHKKCDGVVCDKRVLYYYDCPSNRCLVCTNNVLQIYSECDNSDNCTKEGCLNCITDDECLICMQGYYLLNGICKRCTEGCSICADSNECINCLSGFELNSNKRCIPSNKFDYNINLYKMKKNKLIKKNYPDENVIDLGSLDIPECDKNCLKCYQNTGVCKECDSLYKLTDNKCEKYCSDTNCEECSMINGFEKCSKCKTDYILKNGLCVYNCTDINCISCVFENETETCVKCDPNYDLDKKNNKCKKKINYVSIAFAFIGLILLIISIVSFCIYRKKRREYRNRLMLSYMPGSNINVYHRNNNRVDVSERPVLSKEELAEEFEIQKNKTEKGNQMCQFCKKKAGKFKCDCGCIVCKEHSSLKNMEGDGENYKVCFACGKIVKKVSPIKYDCNICMVKKLNVAHFKCKCSLLVCKDCYIKCKMSNEKCPQCRNEI